MIIRTHRLLERGGTLIQFEVTLDKHECKERPNHNGPLKSRGSGLGHGDKGRGGLPAGNQEAEKDLYDRQRCASDITAKVTCVGQPVSLLS